MTPTPLVLVGAGGLGRETLAAVHAVNERHPTWSVVGFLDDDPHLEGTTVAGIPVLGPATADAIPADALLTLCLGSPRRNAVRPRKATELGLGDDRYASVVHPAAVLGSGTTVGAGAIVLAQVVATASVEIGGHVVVMPATVLTHDDRIGDFVTFGAGARVGGAVTIGAGAYIGSGALLREGIRVGDGALIGMGAVVTRDVPAGEVWVGVPAAPMADAAPPQQWIRDDSATPQMASGR